MATTNGQRVTAVPMTEEQKFFLDLRGWILLPAVLNEAEIKEMKAEVYAGAKNNYEGKLQETLDHPAIVGILSEILSEDPFQAEDCHSFRCEGAFITVRQPGLFQRQPLPVTVQRPEYSGPLARIRTLRLPRGPDAGICGARSAVP